MNGTTPVIVGCGQLTDRDGDGWRSPVELMAESARAAADDSGAGRRLLDAVDTLSVVGVIGWPYEDAPGLLSRRLAIEPVRKQYSWIGGNTPQWLINRSCRSIASGGIGVALLSGAEALAGHARATREGRRPDWELGAGGRPERVGDLRPGTNEHENAHGMFMPSSIYPLFENALRADAGRDQQEHLAYLGRLWKRFTDVAAQNPNAWFRTPRSAEEICTPSPANRIVAWPYTKYMNAVLDVDQSASLILTSADRARSLGIDESRWVFLHGYGDANDLWYVSGRRDYVSSPAISTVARHALEMAEVGVEDIDWFDLYSCFPSSVQITRAAIGIANEDPRPLTVTGGLAAHGGAGNNYVMHAVATMVDRVRAERGRLGMVTGMGWYVTKHSVGVYGAQPPAQPWRSVDPATDQAALDRIGHPELCLEPAGRGRIETYTVPYDKADGPQPAIVIGRLQSGERFLARTPADAGLLAELVESEGIGRWGTVEAGEDGVNVLRPD